MAARTCSGCGNYLHGSEFSSNQWQKGEGRSRCMDCVDSRNFAAASHVCSTCGRYFNSQNNLNMHMQVHRPRTIACPVCGEARFGSGANAVQHVESGHCTGCRGTDNARQEIYKFVNGKQQMRQFMPLMLEYQGQATNQVPDFPYHCQPCNKKFRQLSQLLQHQDQKHNNHLALTNY
jgi:DNA-directed RNA polymerase subunit RPC12/RpoP